MVVSWIRNNSSCTKNFVIKQKSADLIKISLPYLLAIENLDLICPNGSRVV